MNETCTNVFLWLKAESITYVLQLKTVILWQPEFWLMETDTELEKD